jgi:hypothetical protein
LSLRKEAGSKTSVCIPGAVKEPERIVGQTIYPENKQTFVLLFMGGYAGLGIVFETLTPLVCFSSTKNLETLTENDFTHL